MGFPLGFPNAVAFHLIAVRNATSMHAYFERTLLLIIYKLTFDLFHR